MKSTKLADLLFESRYALGLVLLVTTLLSFSMLGTRELWTQEARWGTICWNMLIRGDFLHPYCYGSAYYDKPLLTYWLPLLVTFATNHFNEWTLRLPSALAGLLSVYSIYRIGLLTGSRRVGLMAAWMTASTFFFIFWSRTVSADIYNIAGITFALAIYFQHRDKINFLPYLAFFLVVFITSLCKGVIAFAITMLVLLPEMLAEKRWQKHLNWRFLLACLIGLGVYLIPFVLSSMHPAPGYQESGLQEVFQENFLRYFAAFDHKDPFYLYFYTLPLYLLPWTLFFIPAIYFTIKDWRKLTSGARWSAWALLLVFVFMDLSSSRRNYYTLNMLPFGILFTAHWLASGEQSIRKANWVAKISVVFSVLLFVTFVIVQPYFTKERPLTKFADKVKAETRLRLADWKQWQVVMMDASVKLPFYLRSPHPAIYVDPKHADDKLISVLAKHPYAVIITRAKPYPKLQDALPTYSLVVQDKQKYGHDDNYTMALLPLQKNWAALAAELNPKSLYVYGSKGYNYP